ncbi:MAG: hypothetical protein NT075_21885, partial [Chloroflexi bacterium]|nr:hypothetical protein [Chloroflexota bacterium]
MVSITLNEQTAQELQQAAKARAMETSVLAEQAIRNFLRAEARRAMQREIKAFRKLHPELWKTIPNEYAAVYQGKLIDHDTDQLTLFMRVEVQYPGLTVLIRQVRST